MSSLIPFNFNGHVLNTMLVNNEPYFIARNVAEILGYSKPENAIARHCKASITTPKQGGGFITLIPERDVYRLTMRSKLEEAEKFENWVVGEVLPSIRKTGSYGVVNFNIPQTLPEALRLAADLEEKNQELLSINQEQSFKIESLESLFVVGETIFEFCKKLNGVNIHSVNRLFEQKGWIYNEGRSSTRWRVRSYARDRYMTEEIKPVMDFIVHKPVLLKNGAIKLYGMYLKNELPMKNNWNGLFTQDKELRGAA